MNFVIIGAGALGSIYAAYLSRAGHEVSLIARGERAAALERHSLSVVGKGAFSVRCNIVTQPETIGQVDVVIVATKTYDTESALRRFGGVRSRVRFPRRTAIAMMGGNVPAEGDRPGRCVARSPRRPRSANR